MTIKTFRLSLPICIGLGFFAAISTYGTDIAGPAVVTGGSNGTLDADGPLISFGSIGGNPGISLIFSDSTATTGPTGDTLTFSANRTSASWLWLHNASKSAMRLNSLHQLLLYQADGSTAGITLTPVSNQISFGSATLTGSGTSLTAGGALTVSGALTASSGITNANGSLKGAGLGLSLDAGTAGQNITLTTSGTTSGDIVFNTGGAERARIKSSGYVGIGTPSPNQLLHANGFNAVILVTDSNSGGGTFRLGATDGSKGQWAYDGTANTYFDFAQTLRVRSVTGGTYDRLAVLSNGNVGIGTTAPVARLQLGNNTNGLLPANTEIAIQGGKTIRFMGTDGNGDYGAYFSTSFSTATILTLGTRHGAGDIATLSLFGGNVGIGTTAPVARLQLGNNTNGPLPANTEIAVQGGKAIRFMGTDGNGDYGAYFSTSYSTGTVLTLGTRHGAGDIDTLSLLGGNVGVGTTNPAASLDVGGFAAAGALRTVFARQAEGNTTGAGTFLGVKAWGTQATPYNNKLFSIESSFYGYLNSSIEFYRGSGAQGGFTTFTTGDGTERVRIDGSGNVGIGTTNPTQKLSVAGTVRAYAVVVDTGWSDYVFDQDYRLAPLSEIEAHIKAHKHLPGIPSAAEVAEHGVSLGDMQSKLLAKIEELTLRQIAQEKQLNAQATRIAQLEQENHTLRITQP